MDDKLKVLWNLDVLVKMCRSKSDGPSLRIEEVEIKDKIRGYQQDINDLKSLSDDDSYDSSAEMADRNIEIITKKQLQTLKNELKDKNKELDNLKESETKAYESTNVLRETKTSYEKYILSMQDRVESVNDNDTVNRYNKLINETSSKIGDIIKELKIENKDYETIQEKIIALTEEINELEEVIDKKKKLLNETQKNLENKDNYIDHTKRDKNNKRINELKTKIDVLNKRLEIIQKDPKYIETKIKDIINSGDAPENAKSYLVDLINIVIRQPYINVPDDNKLEEELLRATQSRDSFANEIDQKSYNILDANTPEKIRISFLEKRINNWQTELTELEAKVALVDQDKVFEYKVKDQEMVNMINEMKQDLIEFQKAYDETDDSNISLKASLKASLDEKREDIVEAEKIATQFRLDEAKDIEKASFMIKNDSEELKNNIINAQKEIANMRNRLLSRKSGLIDIGTRNKDKDTLKELAQTVIDLKHRRQFPDTPIDVIRRLENELKINLIDSIDKTIIDNSKELVPKNYDNYNSESLTISKTKEETKGLEDKRGIKVVNEDEIPNPEQLNQLPNIEQQEKQSENINEIVVPNSEELKDIPNTETPSIDVSNSEINEPNDVPSEVVINDLDTSPENIVDEQNDEVIEPILTIQVTEPTENSVKESVQPEETAQNDNTQTENNDNIVISDAQ